MLREAQRHASAARLREHRLTRLLEHIIGMPIRIDFIKRFKTLEEISKVSCDIEECGPSDTTNTTGGSALSNR